MKLAIVGPRDLELPVKEIIRTLKSIHERDCDLSHVTEIVTGDATGVDASARTFARKTGMPWVAFGAGWGRLNNGAGPERNGRLVSYLEPREDIMVALMDRFGTPGTEDVTSKASQNEIFTVLHKEEWWSKYRRKKK